MQEADGLLWWLGKSGHQGHRGKGTDLECILEVTVKIEWRMLGAKQSGCFLCFWLEQLWSVAPFRGGNWGERV